MADVAKQESNWVREQFNDLRLKITQKDIDRANSGELHRELQEVIDTDKNRGL